MPEFWALTSSVWNFSAQIADSWWGEKRAPIKRLLPQASEFQMNVSTSQQTWEVQNISAEIS